MDKDANYIVRELLLEKLPRITYTTQSTCSSESEFYKLLKHTSNKENNVICWFFCCSFRRQLPWETPDETHPSWEFMSSQDIREGLWPMQQSAQTWMRNRHLVCSPLSSRLPAYTAETSRIAASSDIKDKNSRKGVHKPHNYPEDNKSII